MVDSSSMKDSLNWLASIAYEENGSLTNEIQEVTTGYGISRSVWLFDNLAIKFQQIEGNRQNQLEWDLYHGINSKELLAMMCRPVAISNCGNVIAFERIDSTLYDARSCDRHCEETYAKLCDFNDELRELLSDEGYGEYDIDVIMRDNHDENVGYDHEGNLVWIDYAPCN